VCADILTVSRLRCAVQAFHYLSSIAVKDGKVFALFVRSPTKVRTPCSKQHRILLQTCSAAVLACLFLPLLCPHTVQKQCHLSAPCQSLGDQGVLTCLHQFACAND
jgi:hypothetical protein